jgi:hypothetical protein
VLCKEAGVGVVISRRLETYAERARKTHAERGGAQMDVIGKAGKELGII